MRLTIEVTAAVWNSGAVEEILELLGRLETLDAKGIRRVAELIS